MVQDFKLDPTCIDSFTSEKAAWKGMLADIKNATDKIIYEQFIFTSLEEGEIGYKFSEAFIKAAKRGVKVSLYLDIQGSYKCYFNSDLKARFKNAGVELNFYHAMPINKLFSPARLLIRDHRKVLVIDNKISWIGGVVVGELFRGWLDYVWRISSEEYGNKMVEELDEQFERLETGDRAVAPYRKLAEDSWLIGNSPGIGNRHVYEEICQKIMTAKDQVIISTPYFSLPLRIRRVIKQSLEDGVKVKLMLPRYTDHSLADWARWHYLPELLNLGLELYFSDTMNHAKAIVVDDKWATMGSTNLDYLSLVFNHELNISTSNSELVSIIKSQLQAWLDEEYKLVGEEELIKIKPNWLKRLVGSIVRFIT